MSTGPGLRPAVLALAMAAVIAIPVAFATAQVHAQQVAAQQQSEDPVGETRQHKDEKGAGVQASEQDLDFANLAARNAHAVVKIGNYVLDETENQEIRTLARDLVDVSNETIDRLDEIAASAQFDVPQAAGEKGEQLYHRFTGNWDDGLDLLYATQMEILLAKLTDAYELEAKSGSDQQLTQLAEDTLPKLKEQQDKVDALQKSLKQQQRTISGQR